jgi:Zn-dependent oligopeptidase
MPKYDYISYLWQLAFTYMCAQNPDTRRSAYEAYEDRLAINAPLLEKALGLRRKIAKLLSYPTWAGTSIL